MARGAADSRAAWLERVRQVDDAGYDVLLLPDHLGMWPPFAPLVVRRLLAGEEVTSDGHHRLERSSTA